MSETMPSMPAPEKEEKIEITPQEQIPKVERVEDEEMKLWGEREELMRKLRELPGNPLNLYQQLTANGEKIRQAQAKRNEIK